MKNLFTEGDKKHYSHIVIESDFAHFPDDKVHEVYSTFALTRDAEWCARLFVLEMKEEHEEGIGTEVHIEHHPPAFSNDEVQFEAIWGSLEGNELYCLVKASVKDRIIASGYTKQKIVEKKKLEQLFNRIQNNEN